MTAWHIAAMAAGCLLFSLVLGILVGRAIAVTDRRDAAADEHADWLGADAGGSFHGRGL
jgi:hypothetical protein